MPTIALAEISIPSDRHREDSGNLEALAESIRVRGLINPIVLEEVDGTLVLRAGFRRYSAHMILAERGQSAKGRKIGHIEYRKWSALTPLERETLELEENLHRKQLTWEEEAKGIKLVHEQWVALDPNWNQKQTADYLGVGHSTVERAIAVADAIVRGSVRSEGVKTVNQAYNQIRRQRSRELASVLDDLDDVINEDQEVPAQPAPSSERSIIQASALEFLPLYEGARFNFLHCDFPYGINYSNSDMGGSKNRWSSYSDDPDLYWHLLGCLADNWPKFMAASSHLVFWLSMSKLVPTLEFFRERLPQIELWPNPLIWHKSDNKGILADANRGPRHTYEVALFGSTGDRKVVKAKADSYAAPTSRASSIHQAEKPQPMLEFFFEMIVDSHTRVLDPTCGSGTALRAAERLGATQVLGLDIQEEYVEAANRELEKQRRLIAMNKVRSDA